MFGYTSIDQGLAPFYMLPYLWIVDLVPPLRSALVSEQDSHSSFCQSLRQVMKTFQQNRGRAFFTVFAYRFLINARAMAYFYMGVVYDLATVYLELTLVRIVLSWMFALVVCRFAPDFIGLSPAERNTVFAPMNILCKVIGTFFVIGALVILYS